MRIRVEVRQLGDGQILLQVGGEWHLVLAAADAQRVGGMLAAAATEQPARIRSWTHHVHTRGNDADQ